MNKLLLLTIAAIAVLSSCSDLKRSNPKHGKPDSLDMGLVAYYPFNNSAADSSGNGFDGIVYGAKPTADRNGNANSAYEFDGLRNCIRVKDTLALRLSNTDYTMNSWVCINNYDPSYGSIIIDKRADGSQNGWNFGVAGFGDLTNNIKAVGVVTLGISGGEDPAAIGGIKISTNDWHMLTSVYNLAKQQVSIYIDGKLDSVSPNIPSPNKQTKADMYIGGDNPNITDQYFWNGKIDDVRIYNRALKANEVSELYALAD